MAGKNEANGDKAALIAPEVILGCGTPLSNPIPDRLVMCSRKFASTESPNSDLRNASGNEWLRGRRVIFRGVDVIFVETGYQTIFVEAGHQIFAQIAALSAGASGRLRTPM
jgi:hypothetical protein